MNNSIVCCYLTHNHPETIEDILRRSLVYYTDQGIDVCVFDDSDDDKTKKIVNDHAIDNKRLFYIDAHWAVNGGEKLLGILKGQGLPKKYDYIWISKDRVCFDKECIEKLCSIIDDGYDVVQLADENQRWDISRPTMRDVYTEADEFYRDYMVYVTNWEGTIRKTETMLDPVDWDRYSNGYNVTDCNSFTHSVSLFVRLAEVESFRTAIVRFEGDQRYISPFSSSGWSVERYELWMEQWVAANYLLPHIYDKYKIAAIRSQTALRELFGSAEQMMDYYLRNEYDRRIYEKYEKIWPIITDVKSEWLKLIADGKINEVKTEIMESFAAAFRCHDYDWAYRLMSTNGWFDEVYDKHTYEAMTVYGLIHKDHMIRFGHSSVFDGIDSIDELVSRYDEKVYNDRYSDI